MTTNDISLKELLKKKPTATNVLWKAVNDYFQDEEHEREFEVWYEKKYGKPYNRGQL